MYEFTSESVSKGHPDKIADRISDAVATYLIDKNIKHRAAVETLVTTNMVTLAGEYKSDKFDKVYIEKLIRASVLSGVITKDQDGQVTIVDINGKATDVPSAKIRSRQASEESAMPRMGEALSKRQIRDLIAFLKNQKRKR